MTKLPQKDLLSGSKTPRTTTGEMKNALGKLRDFLSELFGEDSADKEGARQTLGIDLSSLASKPDVEKALLFKADKSEMDVALSEKANRDDLNALEEAIAKRGTPVGSIEFFAMASAPAGYLKADGSAVGRDTYPDLFAAIGTTFGEGDGSTTFNLPDLMDRFAEGSSTPGVKREAGLPNITGTMGAGIQYPSSFSGALYNSSMGGSKAPNADATSIGLGFDASRSNPIYGASHTVQPPSLTLLPCIKAFDAATNPGLIDVTALAGEMNAKLDKSVDGKPVRYVTDAFSDGTNWFRTWSDGWLEQGGNGKSGATLAFITPFADTSYTFLPSFKLSADSNLWGYTIRAASPNVTSIYVATGDVGPARTTTGIPFSWYACGMKA